MSGNTNRNGRLEVSSISLERVHTSNMNSWRNTSTSHSAEIPMVTELPLLGVHEHMHETITTPSTPSEEDANTNTAGDTETSMTRYPFIPDYQAPAPSAFSQYLRSLETGWTNEIDLYALRYWYTQYHILDIFAPFASSLSRSQIFLTLLSKVKDHDERRIFMDRLFLVSWYGPERERWHEKMVEDLGGGFGMTAKVIVMEHENEKGEKGKSLEVEWEELTEEENEFVHEWLRDED